MGHPSHWSAEMHTLSEETLFLVQVFDRLESGVVLAVLIWHYSLAFDSDLLHFLFLIPYFEQFE